MNVAWLMPNLHVTGGARVAVELGNRMVGRGHRFFILIPAGRRGLKLECRAEVVECGRAVGSPLMAIPLGMLAMALRLPRCDILMASMPPYALLGRGLGWWRGIPAVNYVLNDDVRFFDDKTFIKQGWLLSLYRTIARWSIRKPPLLVNSHWTAVRCVTERGARFSAVVPHGYSPEGFYPTSDDMREGSPTRLVTVGRHIRWKGMADLVAALNLIDNSEHPFKLRIISQDSLDLSPARFPVEVVKPSGDRELADHYRWGEIFIHSSWFEGFGMPPLEAQACGLAVVATDSGGVREFLRDGENALMVSPREPGSMARAVKRLIDDGELRRRLAARGLRTCTEFTWDKATDKLEAVLMDLISRKR